MSLYQIVFVSIAVASWLVDQPSFVPYTRCRDRSVLSCPVPSCRDALYNIVQYYNYNYNYNYDYNNNNYNYNYSQCFFVNRCRRRRRRRRGRGRGRGRRRPYFFARKHTIFIKKLTKKLKKTVSRRRKGGKLGFL